MNELDQVTRVVRVGPQYRVTIAGEVCLVDADAGNREAHLVAAWIAAGGVPEEEGGQ